ncbi:hypothetical protein EI94DRAFT_1722285 [Lactarius quietus]|nr:hypothetical protein EI94DRAFT_1722285 [Lactarius quietus]
MVYALWRSHTLVRRTNNMLNMLSIYTLNCGILNLAFSIPSLILLTMYPLDFTYAPTDFIMIRLYFCAFMAILNTRDKLRDMLDKPDVVVATFTNFKAFTPPGSSVQSDVQVTTEPITKMGDPKSLPPVQMSSYTSFLNGVMASDRETYSLPVPPVPPVPAAFMA